MASNWHNKHISTKWGIALFGWLLVSIALLIPLLGQEQDNRSNAMYRNEGGSYPTRYPSVAPTRKPLPTVVPTKKPLPTNIPTQAPPRSWLW